MRRKITTIRILLFSSSLALAFLIPSSTTTFATEGIAVIVNVSNPVEKITRRELSDYFFRVKREWPNGSSVRFIDRSPSPERTIFLKQILGKSSQEVDRYWIAQKLQRGLSAPTQSPSERNSIEFVSLFKGAIGYVAAGTTISNKDVKRIELQD